MNEHWIVLRKSMLLCQLKEHVHEHSFDGRLKNFYFFYQDDHLNRT